jgi:hypothetical protein
MGSEVLPINEEARDAPLEQRSGAGPSSVETLVCAAGGGGNSQGPPHPVHRHLPFRQCLQSAARRLPRSAARFDQEATEDGKLGHGLFTYAVVEGLAVRQRISTKDLADYVIKRVGELAKSQKQEREP